MFPVAGSAYKRSDYLKIDLSISNIDLQNVDNQFGITEYVRSQTASYNKKIAFGGYGEERDFYLKSNLFSDTGRSIHLGIDIWLSVGDAVYSPLIGEVHSKNYNGRDLDYGYTVILKHEQDRAIMHTLYGHLSSKGFDQLKIGQVIDQGDIIGYIGDVHENGNWSPHLHFQLIKDLESMVGDYPGVCHKSDSDKYFTNCPDPTYLVLPK